MSFFDTVEPRSTDTRLIRTPAYNGQFRLFRQKAHIFSLKLTRFIRTPVNTLYGQWTLFCVPSHKLPNLSTPLYGDWLSAQCLFSLSQLKHHEIFDFQQSVFLPVFDSCTTFSPLMKSSASCYTRFTSLAFCRRPYFCSYKCLKFNREFKKTRHSKRYSCLAHNFRLLYMFQTLLITYENTSVHRVSKYNSGTFCCLCSTFLGNQEILHDG